MTLLNKPYKKPRKKEVMENSHQEEDETTKEYVSTKDRTKYVDLGLWFMSILVLFTVIGTAFYSYLSITVNSKSEALLSDDHKSLKFISKPSEIDIYQFDTPKIAPDFSKVDAASVYAFNPITQQVYYSNQIDQSSSIASITKLLTVLVASEHFTNDDYLVTSDMDLSNIAWRLGLQPGDRIKYGDAVKAMMINSYNDVAYIVAQNHPEGYEGFIKEMNNKAHEIGMEDSNFENPAGLDNPEHYSTSRDLKRLVQLALKNKMITQNVKSATGIVQVERKGPDGVYIVEKISLNTTNELLEIGDNSVVGLKTGYTTDAGQSFIGYFVGEGSDQLITIILKANGDRFEETMDLVDEIRNVF